VLVTAASLCWLLLCWLLLCWLLLCWLLLCWLLLCWPPVVAGLVACHG
jgi:hypothetical protein